MRSHAHNMLARLNQTAGEGNIKAVRPSFGTRNVCQTQSADRLAVDRELNQPGRSTEARPRYPAGSMAATFATEVDIVELARVSAPTR